MNRHANRGQLLLKIKPKRYTTVIMMLVIWAGVMGSLFAGIGQDIRNKESLLGRAVTVADTLPLDEVRSLKGERADVSRTAYKDLKSRIEKVRRDNNDLNSVYLMGKVGTKVFFYMDSETPNTVGYSAPGDIYKEASARLAGAFTSTKPFVEGPARDSFGVRISSVAPVIDGKSGEVVAVVGTRVKAITYYRQIALYALIPLLLSAIPLAGLIRDRKLEDKEREINQLKNQFVSIASHELRSPLTGMIWAIQSLLRTEENMSKKQQDLLGSMFRSTESSLATVNEILDLSIFERGQAQKLQHEQVNLLPVLTQVIATLKLGAEEKKIKVRLTGDWPEQASTIGDVAALKRSFMNLVTNAIKYSPARSEVDITYRLSDNDHIIAIRDRGIGIPATEQQKVLGGYYRATNASEQEAHGTGLGLWLSKMILEQHGGRLWLQSHVHKGTTIYVALPSGNGSIKPRDQP